MPLVRSLPLLAVCVPLAFSGCGGQQKLGAEMAGAPQGSNVPAGPPVDKTKCNEKDKKIITSDTDLDKKPDVWKYYQSKEINGQKVEVLVCKQVDLNHDGRLDMVSYYDDAGQKVEMEEADLDFDGRFDAAFYFANGKKVRIESDMNFDSKVDVWKYFEEEKLVRIERDTNSDGRVDEWQYYEGGRLDRIGYDTTGSGKVDKWDRAPEGEDTEGGGAAAPAPAAPGAPPAAAPTVPPPAASTTPPAAPAAGAPKPATAAAPAAPAAAKKK